MAYCTPANLLKGDMELGKNYGDGTAIVSFAADEMDAAFGHLYVVPIVIADIPENKPSLLLLKKINVLLASGRLILDQAIGGEDDNRHAYGQSLLEEAKILIEKVCNRDIVLVGAEELPGVADDENNAVSIHNEDSVSLVGSFYDRFQTNGLGLKSPMIFGGN